MKLKFFLIAAFTIYALTTGGLVVYLDNDFGGQNNIRLVENLQSDVWIEPTFSNFGIPFIFHYQSTGTPFNLRLQIWDKSKQYQQIDISEVILEYSDSEVVRNKNVWSRKLKPYVQHNSSSSGDFETEMLMLSDKIEGLVLRHTDVKISLKGQLVNKTGERLPFSVWEDFKAESRSGVTTWWTILSSV